MFLHLALDGVAESSLGVGIDIIGTAARLSAAGLSDVPGPASVWDQRVVSLDGHPVRSGAGRPLHIDGALSEPGPTDVLVIPGVFGATARSLGRLLALDEMARLGELLAQATQRGTTLAASCSATFVLASAGVLDGQQATTTWWLSPVFARRFPRVSLCADRMVVEAGRVITAGSALAHADLLLALVARAGGPSLARLVARYLVLDDRPSQTRYMVMEHLRVSDPAVRAAERFASANVGRQITIDELAHAAAVSPRTLARRIRADLGVSPHELVQRVRVSHAAHLLDTTRASVEEVAERVGYADAAAFRRVFRRLTGESPRGRRPA